MDSLPFSPSPTLCALLLHSKTIPKTLYFSSSPSWQSMVPPVPYLIYSSVGFSNSAFPQQGFSSSMPMLRGSWSSSRSLCVHAGIATDNSIYDFTVKDIDGKDVPISKFKGKVLLIVNVASKCGFTTSNYTELLQLYEKYKSQGLEILAFPCNQFRGQEPGSNEEIKQFVCTRFKAEFPIFDKVDVNGPNAAPLYQFLKSSAGGSDKIKWNFEKFLVDKNGEVVERYRPTVSPLLMEEDIQKLLAASILR